MKFFNKIETKKGFSLVEILVSIAIISLAITGPITATEYSFKTALYAREKVMAGFLATEALEYIRYLITNNNINDVNWTTNLDECLATNQLCGIDPTNVNNGGADKIVVCSSANNQCLLNFNNTTGFFSHRTGTDFTPTIFRRAIDIENLETATGQPVLRVIVYMNWSNRGFNTSNQQFVIYEDFFDWRSQPN